MPPATRGLRPSSLSLISQMRRSGVIPQLARLSREFTRQRPRRRAEAPACLPCRGEMASNPTSSLSTSEDVQARRPSVQLSLSRVGVTDVEKVIRIQQNGSEQLFSARFECVVELGPDQKGAHMSRFEEVVNDAIGEVVLGESTFKAETLAEHIAHLVRTRQHARRAEVSIEARFPEHKPAPVSGINTQELYTLHGSAVATELGTRRLIGVTAQGMTACPCAQELVAAHARKNLESQGFDDEDIEKILDAVPVATHNQRGLGTLHIGCT